MLYVTVIFRFHGITTNLTELILERTDLGPTQIDLMFFPYLLYSPTMVQFIFHSLYTKMNQPIPI